MQDFYIGPQQVREPVVVDEILHMSNGPHQITGRQFKFPIHGAPPYTALPPPLREGQVQPDFQGSTLRGQAERISIDRQPTHPLVPPPNQSPGRNLSGRRRLLMVFSIGLVCLIVAGGGAFIVHRLLKIRPPLPLKTIVDVTVNNQTSRFDYESLDSQSGFLFVSQPGNNSVLIFDTRNNKMIADVPHITDSHGILAIPELGRVYISSATANQVVVMSEQTHMVITTIPTGEGPDGSAYDPVDHKLFVSDEAGHSDTVIDVLTEKRTDTIPLGGEAGNTQYDPGSHLILVNVQTLNQLVAIDPTNDRIVHRYPLPGCNNNHGLNIDAAQRIAFIACTDNNVLLMVDLRTMKVLDRGTIGAGADVLALDSGRHILYVASESGEVSAFQELPSTVHRLATGYVGIHAHTVVVDQHTHDLYLPLQNVNGKSVMRVALFQP